MTDARVESTAKEQILCITCGYDLRGLAGEGACPECGASIARSRLGDRLAAADAKWLAKITLGQTIVSIGLAACVWSIALAIIGIVLIMMLYATSSLSPIFAMLAFVPAAIGFYGGLVACAIGTFPLTIMDPRNTLTEETFSPRRVARWGMLALLAVVTATYALRFFWPVAQPTGVRMLHVVLVTALLAVLMSASLRHLASLLARTSRHHLVLETWAIERRLKWLIPVTGVLLLPPMALGRDNALRGFIGCASIIMIIGLFSSAAHLAVVMGRARSEFRDCLRRSRLLTDSGQAVK